jgi:DNA repair exonuclease SbcCD ATPase subunit
MNGVLKDKFLVLKENHSQAKYAVDFKSEKIQYQIQFIDSLKKDNETKIALQEQQIADSKQKVTESETKCAEIKSAINELRQQIVDELTVKKKIVKYDGIRSNLTKTVAKVESDIKFYHNTDECPTCRQGIDSNFKDTIISERHKKLIEVEGAIQKLNTEYDTLSLRAQEIETLLETVQQENSKLTAEQSEIVATKRYIKNIEQEIERLGSAKDDLKTETDKLNALNAEMADLELNIKTISEERLYYEVATTLLKDTGIKTKIIRQYIPVINKLVNKYLAALDFFVNFNLDESFKETIKSRHRDDFTYASFSEGEKQRIDMALMLTWRAVAKLKNSSNTNILILDEIFDSSLDTNGTEDLMKILNMLDGSNLFVISHKGDILQDKFANVIRFEKVNNFSRITK